MATTARRSWPRHRSFFSRQLLIYTLNPPLLGPDLVDEFLFDTKRGFCEHFAAAFVYALRSAGVPARVVAGYQGGEVNPVDGYLVVRQYDAHAWTEAWIAGRGWVRIDPTAISAPSRINSNLAAAVPAGEDLPFLARTDLTWIRELRYRLDAVTNGWNQWVLGYNPQKQRDLSCRPRPGRTRLAQHDGGARGALRRGAAGLTAWVLRNRRRVDPAFAAWRTLCRPSCLTQCRLARLGRDRWPLPTAPPIDPRHMPTGDSRDCRALRPSALCPGPLPGRPANACAAESRDSAHEMACWVLIVLTCTPVAQAAQLRGPRRCQAVHRRDA
jgi:hypothetical protein